MIAWLAALVALLVPSAASATGAQVTLTRHGDDWVAHYVLPSDEEGWSFQRSSTIAGTDRPWRLASWTPHPDDARLARIGDVDVLLPPDGRATVPRDVRIAFRPYEGGLNADYAPALAFTDGALALFTGHFDVQPWSRAGGPDEDRSFHASVSLEAPGDTILVGGTTRRDRARVEGAPTYALLGASTPLSSDYLTAFVDPQLPAWLREELFDFMPRTLELYAERMGPRRGTAKPTVMIDWDGPTPGRNSLGGSTLEGLVVMAMEGDAVLDRNQDMLDRIHWFIAHESAHFWLGQTVQYAQEKDAWIMEGGADLAAIRASLDSDPAYDSATWLARAWNDCRQTLAGGSLETARERGDYRGPYACGAVLMMGAESIETARGGDYFSFVRSLIERHDDPATGVDGDEWLAAFARAGASRRAVDLARAIIEEPGDNPAALLADFARASGIVTLFPPPIATPDAR
ncbi:hypothetical protein [Sphingomicrobium nitratireducens]|uniref:hypothetical protein n=1 Tax=Sphingomicrobium nitratireducens TaxID=2964666 RepID=UPI0022405E3A|nr:hypothetical protein [Sphingomicrobium nitratireducens]